jgi:hypothetical protein
MKVALHNTPKSAPRHLWKAAFSIVWKVKSTRHIASGHRLNPYVIEQPSSQQLTLKDKHVQVERHRVDRPLRAGEGTFQQRTRRTLRSKYRTAAEQRDVAEQRDENEPAESQASRTTGHASQPGRRTHPPFSR